MIEDSVSILETGSDPVKGTPSFSSAVKTLALMETLATLSGPIGVSDLARMAGSSRGTVHKRLATLVEAGFVEQDQYGRYGLSLLTSRIGSGALAQAAPGTRLQAILDQLVAETNETATIAALHRDQALIVQRAESSEVLNVAIRVGTQLPLTYSASSLVLQAFALTPKQRSDLRRAGTQLAAENDILSVVQAGMAVSVDEFVPGLMAVSVPLDDKALSRVVAVTIVGPSVRFDKDAAYAALLSAQNAVKTLSRRPSYSSGTR